MTEDISRRTVDVAVVGAGLSGLTAARELRRAGLSVAVLEARDRVGGKTYTPDLASHRVDIGAHWLDKKHTRALALAKEFGITTARQEMTGRHAMAVGGDLFEFTGDVPMRPVRGMAGLGARLAQLEISARRTPEGFPWLSRHAWRDDGRTFAGWLDRVGDEAARGLMLVACRTIFGAEPHEISLLFALDYFRAGSGPLRLMTFQNGAQDLHLIGGTQQLSERIAAELGDEVLLENPVQRITRAGDRVEVVGARASVDAGQVVVATAPATLTEVVFEPGLSPGRVALQQASRMGAYFKAVMVYDRRWWRVAGASGIGLADRGPVQMTVDVGHSGDRLDEQGVLAAFVTGESARQLPLDSAERREVVLGAVADLLGHDALHPIAYEDYNWTHDEWSLGAPVGVLGPGVLTTAGVHLRQSEGRIHWAGTEASPRFTGYMEGAIIAGERAAQTAMAQHRLETDNRSR